MNAPRALLAEDEPLLARSLALALARAWPGLALLETAEDGERAVQRALTELPDILFLDIRMPVKSGLEAAREIVDDWPEGHALPLIVFVTAYDQYALQAFEREAVDYLLKPIEASRIQQMVARLQRLLAQRRALPASAAEDHMIERLRKLLEGAGLRDEQADAVAPGSPPCAVASSAGGDASLTVLQAWTGNTMHLVKIVDVLYFDASDKYVRVVTAQRDHLIRMPLRELLARLAPESFWQIHRGTVVRVDAIDTVTRDDAGRLRVALRGRPEALAVSRLYAGRFKGS